MNLVKPFPDKPNGLFFLARFPKHKEYKGYAEVVITDDGLLACKCNNGKWYLFRKATEADRKLAATCFKTWEELHAFFDNLSITDWRGNPGLIFVTPLG